MKADSSCFYLLTVVFSISTVFFAFSFFNRLWMNRSSQPFENLNETNSYSLTWDFKIYFAFFKILILETSGCKSMNSDSYCSILGKAGSLPLFFPRFGVWYHLNKYFVDIANWDAFYSIACFNGLYFSSYLIS